MFPKKKTVHKKYRIVDRMHRFQFFIKHFFLSKMFFFSKKNLHHFFPHQKSIKKSAIFCGIQKNLTLRTFAPTKKNVQLNVKKCNKIAYRIVLFELESVVWLHLLHVVIELPTIRNTMYPDTNPSIYMIQYLQCVCYECVYENQLKIYRCHQRRCYAI